MPISQLDQQLLDAAKKGRKEFDELYNTKLKEFQNTYAKANTYDFKNLLGKNATAQEIDYGGGYKLKKGADYSQNGTGWNTFDLVDSQGNVVQNIRHTDSKSTASQIKQALAQSFGSGAFATNGFNEKMSYLSGLGLQDAKGYWDTQYKTQRALEESQNFGTFVNNLGKTVVAHTLKDAQGMKALGFAQKAAGTTMTPEQQAQFNQSQGSAYGVRQDLQAIANGSTQQTADAKFYQQQADMRAKGIDTNLVNHLTNEDGTINQDQQAKFNQLLNGQPMAQNNLTMASAGQDPNITPTSTAPTTPQINFKSGLNDAQKQSITNLINKGSVLNENDAKNVAYALGINDYTQFVGKTGQEAIGSSAGQPTRDTMQANVMQVAQTQPMQKATTDFISQAFESIHGRPPEPDEIARYQNKTTADALTEIQGGAPQPKTQADLDLMNQGFERILNPQSLEDLKAAGLDPSKIVKVVNKLYKPGSFSVDSSSAAMPSEFTGVKGTIKTDGLGVGGNAKYTAGVTAAANDYYGQYLEQIAPQFYADRQSYWNSVLTSSDFREKTLLNLEDKYQLDELSKNLTDIDAKIAAKNTAYSTLLNDIENQPMSMARIIGEGNHVRKLQAVEVNSLLAQREAIQGNYDRAEKMMTNMYNAKVADYTENVAAMKDWYSEQKDFFTKQEQRSYEAKIKEQERDFELYKENLSAVRTLMADYPTANISLNDDYTTAINKASKVPAKGDYAAIADPSGFGGIVIYDKTTGRPVTQINAFGGTTTPTSNTSNVTGSAEQIAQAIKTVESGGNYNASGGSGEFGAYQFMPATWTAWSGEYAKANGINQSLSPTPENQDKVAQYKIQSWLNQGYTPTQIAATWNSGSPDGWETKKGTNQYGVAYDVPAYVQKVTSALASINPTQQQETALPPLPKNVSDAVYKQVSDFGGEKAVSDYQTAMESISTLLKLDPANSTSQDNIQAIYAFAKIMDPSSAVKEGEYKSIEDYGQAVFEKAGLSAQRIFNNSNFLTEEAITNMQNTVLNKAASLQSSYDNLYNQYGGSINRYVSSYMPGFSQGSQYLIDYATPYRQMPVTLTYNGVEYTGTFADYLKAIQN